MNDEREATRLQFIVHRSALIVPMSRGRGTGGLRAGVPGGQNVRVEGSGSTDEAWAAARTTTHQDHVVAHVVGATVLGYFEREEALHFALDIGLVWSILADAQMALAPEAAAVAELNLPLADRSRLRDELHELYSAGPAAGALSLVRPAPAGCLVEAVELYEAGDRRLVVVRGETAGLSVETSAGTREFVVREL
jgi:hypothetical protein